MGTNRVEPELRGNSRRRTHVVRLHRAGDQHRVGALGERGAEVELELPDLVAAETEPGEIVSLDEDLSAELRTKTGELEFPGGRFPVASFPA